MQWFLLPFWQPIAEILRSYDASFAQADEPFCQTDVCDRKGVRKMTRQIFVGNVPIGGGAPVDRKSVV